MNKTLNLTSKLSSFEVLNKQFIRCKCYMLATGENINGSNITLSAVNKAIARNEFYNKCVVAHLYKDENDGKYRVGGHDSKWVVTNTSIEMINECIPFGVIPESANLQLEEVLEPDGQTRNTYLTCEIILWTGRYNIMDAAYSDDVYFNQSCEISVNDYHWDEKDVFVIDDFSFSALCLLNKSNDVEKNVRPCFPSCRVERMNYSLDADKFRRSFEAMIEDFKNFENSDNSSLLNNKPKGVKNMELKKFAEVVSSEKFENSGVQADKYKLLNATDEKVFVLDMEDYKPYGFDYAITKENDVETLVVDFESKTEMSLSATDKITEESFEEFSISEAINVVSEKKADEKVTVQMAELEEAFNKKFDDLKAAYETLDASYKTVLSKAEAYEAEKNQIEAQEHEKAVNDVFKEFADKLSSCSEFLVYKAKTNPADVTVEDVRQKLTLMLGKFMMNSSATKRNFSYNPTQTTLGGDNGKDGTSNRYGHLFDSFIKN